MLRQKKRGRNVMKTKIARFSEAGCERRFAHVLASSRAAPQFHIQSTTERFVCHAPCPVLVVRKSQR